MCDSTGSMRMPVGRRSDLYPSLAGLLLVPVAADFVQPFDRAE